MTAALPQGVSIDPSAPWEATGVAADEEAEEDTDADAMEGAGVAVEDRSSVSEIDDTCLLDFMRFSLRFSSRADRRGVSLFDFLAVEGVTVANADDDEAGVDS